MCVGMARISQVSCLPLACRGCYCSFSPSLSSMFCKKRVCLFVFFLTGAAVGDPLCFLFVPHPFIIFYY